MHEASNVHALSMLDACIVHALSMHVRVRALAIEGEAEVEALSRNRWNSQSVALPAARAHLTDWAIG